MTSLEINGTSVAADRSSRSLAFMADLPRRSSWLLLFAVSVIVAVLFISRRTTEPRTSSPRAEIHSEAKKVPAVNPTAVSAPAQPAASSPAAFAANALFSYAKPANARALDAALPAPAREIHYVTINRPLIEGKQSPFWQKSGEGRFELPLPGGGVLSVVIDTTESLGPQRFTSVGHVEGRPGSRALFAYNEGFLHASVQDADLGAYALRTATEELSQFYQVDPALVPPCGGSPRPVLDGDALTTMAKERTKVSQSPKAARDSGSGSASGNEGPSEPTMAGAAGTNVQVHLMVAYTQAVLPTMSGSARTSAILSAIDEAVAGVNTDLQASLVNARVKLVKTVETQYDETLSTSSNVQSDALTAVRQSTDGKMDELHALRDSCGADLVCLIINRSDSGGTIGIAYILDEPGDNSNPVFAFSVVRYNNISASEHVLSHELGHNFGCAHDRENSPAEGAYSYSYGYRFTGKNNVLYHDIMAYQPGTRLGYFSTPNVTAPAPISSPVGIAAGQAGEADTARTIEQGAFEVASYRLQTEAAYSVGLLQAVSTRAFVGPGEQALIGGFIITGGPKTVLLRGAGPALAPFLSDYLRDPVITLNNISTGQAVDTNNDWTTRPEAGQLGYTAGSKDAGMQVTLAPGAYTANVTAGDGGTGIARIDAYEADNNGARLYALSTRAFADTARPMIGGFTVGGSAGTTKRMIIRVRGPSIAGVTAMDDPYMEIFNATGDLVMINDDWSTGALQGDDFQPLVAIYKEQQIANTQQLYQTGLAPANRREPAVIADFSPGNYTVVIKPFELLPDQVAKPGVAAVDVFEVLPK